jgi:hypothetical protein
MKCGWLSLIFWATRRHCALPPEAVMRAGRALQTLLSYTPWVSPRVIRCSEWRPSVGEEEAQKLDGSLAQETAACLVPVNIYSQRHESQRPLASCDRAYGIRADSDLPRRSSHQTRPRRAVLQTSAVPAPHHPVLPCTRARPHPRELASLMAAYDCLRTSCHLITSAPTQHATQ